MMIFFIVYFWVKSIVLSYVNRTKYVNIFLLCRVFKYGNRNDNNYSFYDKFNLRTIQILNE